MTLALIPARGGSKGIPRKNVRAIAGKPLIAWTIDAALAAQGVSRVVVSTEDEEIAAIAREWGAEVPFMRPANLATDEAPGIAPVIHAAEALPGHDALILLQPTSPLRGSEHIAGLLAFAAERGASSVVSVCEAGKHPAWMYRMNGEGRLEPLMASDAARRQDLPAAYALNGAMYWIRTAELLRTRALVGPDTIGYLMDAESSADIDTPLDWRIAEFLLESRAAGAED